MATFLDLTNELLRRLNEVTIDQADFPTVRNVQSIAKDSINNSIRAILQSAQEWPFTLQTYTQTMTAGTGTYDFPSDMSSVDWESFYIKKLDAKDNSPRKLDVVSYEEYLSRYRPIDDTSGESGQAVPVRIYQTQEEKFGVSPLPDDAYEIEYKYWSFPDTLTTFSDVCVIPDRFRHVIIDGAMMYMMRFRSNDQSAELHRGSFDDGIKMMRRLLVDDKLNIRSTFIPRYRFNSFVISPV